MTLHSDVVPLRRLLERPQAQELLARFALLLPGVTLALFDADGRLFVGAGEGGAELAGALAGETVRTEREWLAPLRVGEDVVGVLAARGKRLITPQANQALDYLYDSLSMFVTQGAERRAMARETLDRYREVNLLYSIGETIGTCLDSEEIPHRVLEEANRVIRADVGVVLLPLDEGGRSLGVKAHFGQPGHIESLVEGAQKVLQQAIGDGRSTIIADLAQDEQTPIGTILCAPLKTQEQVLGAILLGRLPDNPVFIASDEKLLMALASQTAISVENARLFADVMRQRDAIAIMKNYMDNIFASIASGVITTDVQDTIVTLNRAAERILAVEADDLMGRSYVDGLPGFGCEISALVNTVRRYDEQVIGYELEPELPRRGRVVLRLHISPLKDNHEETTGIAIVLDDLTERRQLERQVQLVRATFQRYVAPQVVEQLLSNPASVRLGGVRREITIFYADIRGFTLFSEKVEPELQIEILNRHLNQAAEAVLAAEGTLDKFLGDGVMALFNAPLAQPDHVLRAVQAALRMQRAISEMHKHTPPGEQFMFGIGIATGYAVVGNIGSAMLHNYTAVGDCVNLASRIQEHAGPGQILLSAPAYQRVRDQVVGRELGYIQFKGHSEPDLVFEVLDLIE
ncbi:MAG: GAF domain-containing protein [Anaerolineae bacterium]|nr:GAF domain-containing protein [Anaerolineae bacterium]